MRATTVRGARLAITVELDAEVALARRRLGLGTLQVVLGLGRGWATRRLSLAIRKADDIGAMKAVFGLGAGVVTWAARAPPMIELDAVDARARCWSLRSVGRRWFLRLSLATRKADVRRLLAIGVFLEGAALARRGLSRVNRSPLSHATFLLRTPTWRDSS